MILMVPFQLKIFCDSKWEKNCSISSLEVVLMKAEKWDKINGSFERKTNYTI